MVLNVMMGPDGWRNGRPQRDAAQRDALRCPAFRQAIASFMFSPKMAIQQIHMLISRTTQNQTTKQRAD
jgi:hypothetical protein